MKEAKKEGAMSQKKKWTVWELGFHYGIYDTREEAQAEADRLNAETDEECGFGVVGDGAASVALIDEHEDRLRT